MHEIQPVILEASAKKAHEVGIGLQGDEYRVPPHPPEDFGREGAHAGTVLYKYLGSAPVHFGQDMIYQKPGARDQAPQHARVLDEVSTEEQQLT
jgi:hypothetical protein